MPSVNGVAKSSASGLSLAFGLINNDGKYLTAESFGFKINANGTALRKKQMWTYEQEGENQGYLKSPQKRYLSADKNGNVLCELEEHDPDSIFTIEIQKDGRWALKSKYGHYLKGTEDLVSCVSSKADASVLWAVHLGIHPQVNLRSVARKRYLHSDGAEIHAKKDIPWGKEAVITLQFRSFRYALRACDGKYLNKNGALVEEPKPDCEYIMEFHDNMIAFKDTDGNYLCPYGPDGKIQAGKKASISPSKDELFSFEDSHAQCVLTAHNGKKVSIKQGQDVSANQILAGDTETFQMEFIPGTNNSVVFKTKGNLYWTTDTKKGSGLVASATTISPESTFEIEWCDEKIVLKANNGKYLTAKLTGHLIPTSEKVTEKEYFSFELVNRPLLVLRGEFGYVGMRPGMARVECNRGNYDAFELIRSDSGSFYHIKAKDGKFWGLDDNSSVVGNQETGEKFYIELREPTKLCIKAAKNMKYLQGDQSGGFKASGDEVGKNTLWEH